MAAQPLPRGVLHSLAELDAKPQRLDKVEAAATDPANQVPALNQLQNNVRLALDDLDRVRLDDVRMLTELHPEPALRGKPRPPDLVTQQFVLQGLECDHRPTGFAQVVVDHVDQAHSTFVHVEDLESVTDPVAHTPDAHHERYPIPGSHQRARNHRACWHHYTPDPAFGSDIRQVLYRNSWPVPRVWSEKAGRRSRGPQAPVHLPVGRGKTVEPVRQAGEDNVGFVAKAKLFHHALGGDIEWQGPARDLR